jgi:hypothetical protein
MLANTLVIAWAQWKPPPLDHPTGIHLLFIVAYRKAYHVCPTWIWIDWVLPSYLTSSGFLFWYEMVVIVRWLPPSSGSHQFPGTIPYRRAIFWWYIEHTLFRIKHHLILIEIVKDLFEVGKQIHMLFRLRYYVINISFDVSPNPRLQDDVNALLISCSPTFQPECHLGVIEDSKWCDKRYFFFIINGETDLMIARINIQKW